MKIKFSGNPGSNPGRTLHDFVFTTTDWLVIQFNLFYRREFVLLRAAMTATSRSWPWLHQRGVFFSSWPTSIERVYFPPASILAVIYGHSPWLYGTEFATSLIARCPCPGPFNPTINKLVQTSQNLDVWKGKKINLSLPHLHNQFDLSTLGYWDCGWDVPPS